MSISVRVAQHLRELRDAPVVLGGVRRGRLVAVVDLDRHHPPEAREDLFQARLQRRQEAQVQRGSPTGPACAQRSTASSIEPSVEPQPTTSSSPSSAPCTCGGFSVLANEASLRLRISQPVWFESGS
jgi:hypothetical protein